MRSLAAVYFVAFVLAGFFLDTLWLALVQFVLRVTFGVALAMACTPPRLVTSGFYRVHLWVLLGANTFAALVAWSNLADFSGRGVAMPGLVVSLTTALAVVSYLGAVVWMYERAGLGLGVLGLVALLALAAAICATPWNLEHGAARMVLEGLSLVTGGLVLGLTLTAMFLGHWYLNTPTMQLAPLRRLVILMGGAVLLRGLVCAVGLGLLLAAQGLPNTQRLLLLALRWVSGIAATLVLAGLTWQTLKIPNTQSATGILYAGVILAFIGELTSQLLSMELAYAL